MKRYLTLFLMIVMVVTVFSGLIVAEEGKFGGNLNIGITTDPDSLNPFISNDRIGSWILNNIYPTLMVMNEDAVKVPYVADEINTSEDGTQVVIKLKEGLEWQDGTPFTSADVKFTGEILYEEKLQWQADVFDEVESVETPDDLTIIYNLKKSYPGFIGTFGFWQRIVPEHIFSEVENIREFTNKNPVGLGPFKLVDFKRGQYYTLESVEEWFDSPEGRPYLDTITFRVYPDVNTMVLALQRGEIDLTAKDIPRSQASQLEQDPDFEVVQTPSLGFVYMGFNYNNEFLEDIKLRQAIAVGTDREKIIGMALQGDGQLIDTAISPVYEEYVNPEAKLPKYSPEGARAILSQAGYEDTDSNGIVNDPESGKDVILEMIYDGKDIYLKKSAQILAENYKDIGLRLNLKPLEKSTYSDLLFNQKKFDVNLGGWGIIDEASDSMYTLYHSTAFLNFMSLDSDRLDRYMENARFASNKEEMMENLYAFQQEFVREMPVVTLYVQEYNFAYSKDFGGFTVYPSDLKGLVDPQSLSGVYKK